MNYDENIWKLWNHIQTPTQLLFLPHEKFCSSPRWDSVHFVVHLAFSMADNGTELNFLGTMEPHFSHIFSYFPQYPMATTLRLAMDRTQAFRPSRFGSCGRFDPGLGSSSDGRFVRDLVITLFTTNGYHIWDMTWLVVWNMTFMTFHFIYGMSSFPLTKSYVSRWLKPPTSNKWLPSGDLTVRALENHHVYER